MSIKCRPLELRASVTLPLGGTVHMFAPQTEYTRSYIANTRSIYAQCL